LFLTPSCSAQFTAKNQANIRSNNYFCFLNFNP
jgi:hypothetical protein